MNLEELQQSSWYKKRPKIIQQAIDLMPPNKPYMLKASGKQCFIMGYDEPENGKFEDVTLLVAKTGIGGVMAEMGLGALDKNVVFDLKATDLEEWVD